MLVWEDGDVGPQEVTGRYEVEDGVLELDPSGGPPDEFHLTLDGSVLILGPPPGERGLAVRFERRPWIAPWVGAAPAPNHPGSGE